MGDSILKMKKEIYNLKLAKQGIEAEYQYVLEKEKQKNWKLKGEVEQKQKELKSNELKFKNEFAQAVKEIDNYKRELESIKNSRWWKLREKIKGNK